LSAVRDGLVKASSPLVRQKAATVVKRFPLASRIELSDFLAGVERRAFKHAVFALRDEENALDVVQDAMLKLSERYGDRPAGELPALFQRILQNAINDHFRRSKVRNLWTSLLSIFAAGDDEDDAVDPLEVLAAESEDKAFMPPPDQLDRKRLLELLEQEISRLPPRQREAFLMRYWEEMDIAETAAAMGCTEGSVKTHCSRATHTLAAALRAKGIKP